MTGEGTQSGDGGFEGFSSDAGPFASGEGIAEAGDFPGEHLAERDGLGEAGFDLGAFDRAATDAGYGDGVEASWWRAAEADAASAEPQEGGEGAGSVPRDGEAPDMRQAEATDQEAAALLEGSEQVDRDADMLLDREGNERLDREVEQLLGNENLDADAAALIGGREVPLRGDAPAPPPEAVPEAGTARDGEPPSEAAPGFEQRQAERELEAEHGWRETAAEREEFYARAERELAEYRSNPGLYAERLEMTEADYAEAMRDRTMAERIGDAARRAWEGTGDPQVRRAAAEWLIREYDNAVKDFFGRRRR